MKTITVTLSIVLAGAVAGGFVSAQEAEAYCPIDGPCPEEVAASSGVGTLLEDWELSTQRFVYQVEQGILQMARAPRF